MGLILMIIAGLLIFAATEKALREWFEVEISITSDLWNALKQIPDALGKAISDVIKAIGQFLASPFVAFKATLEQYGLSPAFAQGVATMIIVMVLIAIGYAVARWRGWI